MLDDRSKMRGGDMPLLDRIESAMRRVTSGQGQMRVPVEATDPDIVLFDCKREIERLRTATQAALNVLEQLQGGCTDSDDGTVEAITVWCPEVIDELRAALGDADAR